MNYQDTQDWKDYITYKKFVQSIEGQCCENCDFFGGLMCDHLDENYNCLGWEPINWEYQDKVQKQFIEYMGALGKW